MVSSSDTATAAPATRTLLIHPFLKESRKTHADIENRLEEAVSLAHAIDLEVASAKTVLLNQVRPATFLGKGKVEDLGDEIRADAITLVVMDTSLSPIQQRNLEKAWKCKVIDRTALILEIFGERARTAEGKLQVELAALEYQKSRLVRSWTHLERQRGGHGFMGGPGETQIETDRRLIAGQITRIKKELETVKRTRALHRKSRKEVPYPIVALIGYTNAGKSTLFNCLTGSDTYVKDQVFATLDPTMRMLELPSKRQVILSDTVGFISDLPTELIAAFRATLEEVLEADILLHVRDIADPNAEEHKEDVLSVLKKLDVEEDEEHPMIEVWNKIDKIEKTDSLELDISTETISISAQTQQGIPSLLETIDTMLAKTMLTHTLTLDSTEGKLLAWLYAHGQVLSREDDEASIQITVRLSHKDSAYLEKWQEKN